MIVDLASKMRDEFFTIIRSRTAATVAEANDAALAIINKLIAKKSYQDGVITALRAENERLRAALETTTDDCKNAFHENERLRAALEKRACSCLICERSPEDQDDHCEARAALSGADAPSPWRLIEDGVQDTDWRLLWVPDEHGGLPIVGCMDAETWIYRDDERACGQLIKLPTHWMPLPPPPKKEGE